MASYTNITLDGVTLQVLSATPTKRQKTIKSVIGKTLIQNNIIGLGAQQWEIQIRGIITGSTAAVLATNRGLIEAFDDADIHTLVDGIHDGTYYVLPESLIFEDSGEAGNFSYTYTMTLVEE